MTVSLNVSTSELFEASVPPVVMVSLVSHSYVYSHQIGAGGSVCTGEGYDNDFYALIGYLYIWWVLLISWHIS